MKVLSRYGLKVFGVVRVVCDVRSMFVMVVEILFMRNVVVKMSWCCILVR